MKRFKVPLFAAVLGLVLATGTTARAAIGWGVDWSPTANAVYMGGGGSGTVINFSSPGFSSFSILSSQTTASSLTLTTNAPPTNPLVVSLANAQNFQLVAKIYDGPTNSSPSQTLYFNGKLWGVFSTGGVLTSVQWTSLSSQNILFAGTGDTFNVSITNFSGPPIPLLSNNPGQIQAQITETLGIGGGGGGGLHGTPEPSTMLMGCMGLSFLGFASWRKRNRQAA